MITIGLIGGIASGKSLVANIFKELGAAVVSADPLAHLVLNEPDVQRQLIARWGETVVDEQGKTDRAAVARLVFGTEPADKENKHFLEQLLHPRIRQLCEQQLEEHAAANCPAAIIDAPLLLEAGWESICNTIVFVDTPDNLRQKYACERGWSIEDLKLREAAQMPPFAKRNRADHVLNNQGALAELQNQVKRLWQELVVKIS